MEACEHRLDNEGIGTAHVAETPQPCAAAEFGDSAHEFKSLQCSISILQDTCLSHSEALDRGLAHLSGLKDDVKGCLAEELREKVCAVAQRVGSQLWAERRERMLGQQLLQDTLQSQQELLTQLAEFVNSSVRVRSPAKKGCSHGVKKEREDVAAMSSSDSSPTHATQDDSSPTSPSDSSPSQASRLDTAATPSDSSPVQATRWNRPGCSKTWPLRLAVREDMHQSHDPLMSSVNSF